MTKIETIRKINKNIIHEDGTITSFDKQLIQLMSGTYDTKYPLVVSDSTHSLDYIEDFATDNPLVINVSTVIKLREKHDIGYEFVSNCEAYLKESVLAFDSYQQDTSKIILLNEVDDNGFPMIAICRENKDLGGNLLINEITSIYEKEALENLLNNTYEKNKKFYTNEKTEQYIKSIGLQLSKGLTYALSNSYDSQCFNKSQVEKDLLRTAAYNTDLSEREKNIDKAPELKERESFEDIVRLVYVCHDHFSFPTYQIDGTDVYVKDLNCGVGKPNFYFVIPKNDIEGEPTFPFSAQEKRIEIIRPQQIEKNRESKKNVLAEMIVRNQFKFGKTSEEWVDFVSGIHDLELTKELLSELKEMPLVEEFTDDGEYFIVEDASNLFEEKEADMDLDDKKHKQDEFIF